MIANSHESTHSGAGKQQNKASLPFSDILCTINDLIVVLDRLIGDQLSSLDLCPIKFIFGHYNLPKPCHNSILHFNSGINQGEDAFIVSDR